MIQFHLFRLPAVFASLTLLALAGACGKRDAGTGSPAADVSSSTPEVSRKQADQGLPAECLEAEAAHRACVENIAASFERAGQVDGARKLRDALPAEVEEARARWLTAPSKEGLRLSCIAMRDGTLAFPQCQP